MTIHEIVNSTEINFQTALFRLIISFIAGMLIGIEREAHSQPAGLRTHILISIGSTLAMLLSIYIPQEYLGFKNGDPGRIAAQVVTGIGFLGAGAILRFGASVRGLTTAASIWTMAMLGMAVGAGLFKITAAATVIILFSLTIMDVFEKRFFHDRLFKKINITVRKNTSEPEGLRNMIKKMDIRIQEMDITKNTLETTDKYAFYVFIPVKLDPLALSGAIEKIPGVVSFSIEVVD